MSPQTVLVTGGTGFIGSHIIAQLLETEYIIRATARSATKLRSAFPDASPTKLQIIEVPGLESDHTEALRGVDALIHCATPSFVQCHDNLEILNGTYHGTVGLITTAISLGVLKIVYTSSMAALFEPDFSNGFGDDPIGPDSWGSVPLEKIDVGETSPGPVYVYQTAKTAAEKTVWELADEYREKGVDITTILPSVVMGPFVPNFPLTFSSAAMSSNIFILSLLDSPTNSFPDIPFSQIVDVRDVARHHILALSAPPLPLQSGEQKHKHKRLISSNRNFTWGEIVSVIKEKYADDNGILTRLPTNDASEGVRIRAPLDDSLTRRTLRGFEEYLPFEKTVLDTFQAVLDWEKKYKK